jgi:hypothetical protein
VAATERKHEKARLKMAGLITKPAKKKKVVHDTERRGYNTMWYRVRNWILCLGTVVRGR